MELHRYDALPSTNAAARAAAYSLAPEFYTVAANTQSAGRGRLTRRFFSPRGGTYFSVVLRPAFSPALYGALTPFAALSVVRALEQCTGVSTEIKWVNDVLLDGKKLCGILSESGTDKEGRPFVIVGIGINTFSEPFPPELSEIAVSLPYEDKDKLIGAVVEELSQYSVSIPSKTWQAEYRKRACFLRRSVLLIENGETRCVSALDIDENGALIVKNEQGERESVCGGEISLRFGTAPEKTT